MDFAFTGDQEELAGLARRIFADKVTPERLSQVESAPALAGEVPVSAGDAAGSEPERFDRDLWKALADVGLLGIALPEDLGGGGYGPIEHSLVLQEAGRRVAPVPLLAATAFGAAPIAELGTDEQRQRWVAPTIAGEVIVTAALDETTRRWGAALQTTAAATGDGGYVLDGQKTVVPALPLADAVIVPASLGGTTALFIVPTDAAGVTVEAQRTTGESSTGRLTLEGVALEAGALLGPIEGGDAVRRLTERAVLGVCAVQLGVLEEALAATAAYATERVQFERPIATFQAVGHRLADSYIDVEGARLTLWQAVWAWSEGLDAATDIDVAKYWAAEAGHRVAHAAVHVHGGMGVARSHTLHRYFLAAKQHEFLLGSATEHVLGIGAALASAAS